MIMGKLGESVDVFRIRITCLARWPSASTATCLISFGFPRTIMAGCPWWFTCNIKTVQFWEFFWQLEGNSPIVTKSFASLSQVGILSSFCSLPGFTKYQISDTDDLELCSVVTNAKTWVRAENLSLYPDPVRAIELLKSPETIDRDIRQVFVDCVELLP